MLIQVIVLAPIALWCIYELGARIGGRVVGYVAAVVWTLGPYIAIPLFVHRYHDRYVDQFLPIPLGLTAMADYVGTVALARVSPLCRARRRESRRQYRCARGSDGRLRRPDQAIQPDLHRCPDRLAHGGAPLARARRRCSGHGPRADRTRALEVPRLRGRTGFYLRRGAASHSGPTRFKLRSSDTSTSTGST